MVRDVLYAPLRQTLALVWLVALAKLVLYATFAHPGVSWVASAVLAAVLSGLVAARLRRPALLSVAVVLGLGAVMVTASRLGLHAEPALGALVACYATLVWASGIWVLQRAQTSRLVALLRLQGGYGCRGGRAAAEAALHWSGFALVALVVAVAAALVTAEAQLSPSALPVLAVALAFLGLSGARYRSLLHGYLVIPLAVWVILALLAGVVNPDGVAGRASLALDNPWLGTLLACCAVAAWALGTILRRWRHGALYRKPFAAWAAALAMLAAIHSLLLAAAGLLAAPGWPGVASLAIAALVLLASRPLPLGGPLASLGTGLLVLALCGLYSGLAHQSLPAGLWPGGAAPEDQWLVLGLTALALAVAGEVVSRKARGVALYSGPLWLGAALAYGWALLGALALFAAASGGAFLPWLFATLMLGLFAFPVSRAVRGTGVALLATLAAATLWGGRNFSGWSPAAPLAWAYGLWAVANLVIPRCNARWARWALSGASWPWLGLVMAGLAAGLAGTPALLHWGWGAALTGYLFLMARNSSRAPFPWLAALGLTWLGVAAALQHTLGGGANASVAIAGRFALATLTWANLVLLAAWLWQRHGGVLAARLGWRNTRLTTPLIVWPLVLCALWLVVLMAWDGALLLGYAPRVPASSSGVVGAVLFLSLVHVLVRWPSVAITHLAILAASATLLAVWGATRPFHLPLLAALWSALLTVLPPDADSERGVLAQRVGRALVPWKNVAPVLALLALCVVPGVPAAERLATLALLAVVAAVRGRRLADARWVVAAAFMLVVGVHGLWLLWVPMERAVVLLPWFALQSALVSALLRRWSPRLQEGAFPGTWRWLAALVVRQWPWVAGLAALECLLHWVLYAASLGSAGAAPWLMGPWGDGAAALTAVALLVAIGVYEARRSGSARLVYGVALLLVLAGVYLRLLWVGPAPLNVWDTAALMGAAYGVLPLQRLTRSRAVLHLVMILPLMALATVPLQLGSGHAGLSLVAAGALYLLTSRASGLGIPLYLGLLAVNGAAYLWVPHWAQQFDLTQLYLAPAALTVLLLLHLHRRELKSHVLHSARLAALSALYAAGTADVFLHGGFGVFVLALALSMAGVVVGIALRVRAFVYAGVGFLVVNVAGQLIQLYPEQRLQRAVVLMALGAAVTGAMIWFNVKREGILERIRVIRADLAQWA